MKLINLKIYGYGCFDRETEIAFNDGINVVYGPNEAGKSTIINAITKILFGETDNSFIPWLSDDYAGILTFESDKKTYRVSRDFKKNITVVEMLNGDDVVDQKKFEKSSGYKDFISELLNISDEKLFRQIFLIRQQAVQSDITGKDELRAFMIGSVLDNYRDFKKNIENHFENISGKKIDTLKDSRKNGCERLIETKTGELNRKQNDYNLLSALMKESASQENECINKSNEIVNLKKEHDENIAFLNETGRFLKLNEETASLQKQKKEINIQKEKIFELKNKINELNKILSENYPDLIDCKENISDLIKKYEIENNKLISKEDEIERANKDISTKEEEIKKYQAEYDNLDNKYKNVGSDIVFNLQQYFEKKDALSEIGNSKFKFNYVSSAVFVILTLSFLSVAIYKSIIVGAAALVIIIGYFFTKFLKKYIEIKSLKEKEISLLEEISVLKNKLGIFAEIEKSEIENVKSEFNTYNELRIKIDELIKSISVGSIDALKKELAGINNSINLLKSEIGTGLLERYSLDELAQRIDKMKGIKKNIQDNQLQKNMISDVEIEKKESEISLKLDKLYSEEREIIKNNPAFKIYQEDSEKLLEINNKKQSDIAKLDKRTVALQAELTAAQRNHAETTGRLKQLPESDLVKLEEEMEELSEEIKHLEKTASAYKITFDTIEESVSEYQQVHLENIKSSTLKYFTNITSNRYLDLDLANDYEPKLNNEDKKAIETKSLSTGTREQLYLSLRFAFADEILSSKPTDENNRLILPFIFDDPFVNFDSVRLSKVKDLLDSVSEKRQILIFTHNEEYKNWGNFIDLGLVKA